MKLVVVHNLRPNVSKEDIKEKFEEHGPIRIVRSVAGSGIAYIEFEDELDAQEAIDELHDTHFRGSRIKVEFARTWKPGEGPRTEHRLYIEGITHTTQREHLIEFASRVAPPSYVEISEKNGRKIGIIEFENFDDKMLGFRQLHQSRLLGQRVLVSKDDVAWAKYVDDLPASHACSSRQTHVPLINCPDKPGAASRQIRPERQAPSDPRLQRVQPLRKRNKSRSRSRDRSG